MSPSPDNIIDYFEREDCVEIYKNRWQDLNQRRSVDAVQSRLYVQENRISQ